MLQAKNHEETYAKVLALLGSNVTFELKESAELVRDALNCLSERGLRITSVSRYYSTACFPAGAGRISSMWPFGLWWMNLLKFL